MWGEVCGYENTCWGEVKRDVGRGAREKCEGRCGK